MTQITSHVLDTTVGRPAEGILITLLKKEGDTEDVIGSASTDDDGRVSDFAGVAENLPAGVYTLRFALIDYFERSGTDAFYPLVDITFRIDGDGQHYHVPLLLNPFGYSTYRGS